MSSGFWTDPLKDKKACQAFWLKQNKTKCCEIELFLLLIGLPIQLLATWDIFTCGFSPEGTYSRNPSMHNFGCSTNLSLQVSYQEVQCIQYGYVMDTEPKFSQYLKYSSKKVLHVFKISNVPFSTQKRFRKIFVRKCLWLFNNLQKQNDVSFSCQAIQVNLESCKESYCL